MLEALPVAILLVLTKVQNFVSIIFVIFKHERVWMIELLRIKIFKKVKKLIFIVKH